jgi:hypothetical protein
MSERDDTALLVDEIAKTRSVIERLDRNYREFLATDFVALGKKQSTAVVVADVMGNYYTCLETLFLRISQHFENSLSADKWHADLLHKMTMQVQGVRIAAISDQAHAILRELLRFRHFKRYYFDFEYDWDKLEFLQKKYEEVRPMLSRDLDRFAAFLRDLSG